MIKILRVTTVPQSLMAFCGGLGGRLRAEGWQVVAVSSPGAELEEFGRQEQVPVVEVPMQRHISLLSDLKSLFKMIGVLRRERPTLVHSMTPKAGLIAMMAAWLCRVPVRVHTFTGLVWPTATGLKRRLLMATDWLTCACATHIIPEGQGVRHDLLSHHITRKPIQVLGHGNVRGVDLEYWSREAVEDKSHTNQANKTNKETPNSLDSLDSCEPSPSSPNEIQKILEISGTKSELSELSVGDTPTTRRPKEIREIREGAKFTFVFVGRIVRDKGINELAWAFHRLHEEHPEVRLVLVGPYEDNLDPIGSEARSEIDANPAIEAVGSQKDVRPYYAQAQCLVFPSYREGFPNVVLEAGAMGLPSIVTDINGSREIIIEGQNGTIIPPRDREALYQAMKRFVEQPQELAAMAANARPLIAQRFEQSYVRQCQIDFYKKVLSEAGKI